MTNSIPTESITKIVGRQVRRHRQIIGVTQEELASRCGLYRTYLSRIEAGIANPTITVLATLAEAMGIELSNLIREAPDH